MECVTLREILELNLKQPKKLPIQSLRNCFKKPTKLKFNLRKLKKD